MSDETQGGEKSDPRCPYKYLRCPALAELEQIHAEVMLEGEAASIRRLERERDAACEAVGAMGAAATEVEDRMYGRFRQAEIERDEARAKLAAADRLLEKALEAAVRWYLLKHEGADDPPDWIVRNGVDMFRAQARIAIEAEREAESDG